AVSRRAFGGIFSCRDERQRGYRGSGARGEIRTPDLLVRSQTLYPTELRAHAYLKRLPNGVKNSKFCGADGVFCIQMVRWHALIGPDKSLFRWSVSRSRSTPPATRLARSSS